MLSISSNTVIGIGGSRLAPGRSRSGSGPWPSAVDQDQDQDCPKRRLRPMKDRTFDLYSPSPNQPFHACRSGTSGPLPPSPKPKPSRLPRGAYVTRSAPLMFAPAFVTSGYGSGCGTNDDVGLGTGNDGDRDETSVGVRQAGSGRAGSFIAWSTTHGLMLGTG